MAASKDYYQVLGVAETATVDEIKKAFRRLAKQYHPDRNPNNAQASERFKEINEAHDVLSDPDKRKRYDQVRRYGAYAGAGRRRRRCAGLRSGRVRSLGSRLVRRVGGSVLEHLRAAWCGGWGTSGRRGRDRDHGHDPVPRR